MAGWVFLIATAISVTVLIGSVWADLIDKAENIDPDEPCDFWLTDED